MFKIKYSPHFKLKFFFKKEEGKNKHLKNTFKWLN